RTGVVAGVGFELHRAGEDIHRADRAGDGVAGRAQDDAPAASLIQRRYAHLADLDFAGDVEVDRVAGDRDRHVDDLTDRAGVGNSADAAPVVERESRGRVG